MARTKGSTNKNIEKKIKEYFAKKQKEIKQGGKK